MGLRSIPNSIRRAFASRVEVEPLASAVEAEENWPEGYRVRVLEHPFDVQFGVQTSDVIFPANADSEQHGYHGVSPSIFRKACRLWAESIPSTVARGIEDYRFLDLGCGMGRALLLASELPFRQVIGVEVNELCAATARRNLESWLLSGVQNAPIVVHQVDVLDYVFPSAPLLVFLYNPFGCATLATVLERLHQLHTECSSPVDILYIHPEFGQLLDRDLRIELLWREDLTFDSIDTEADAFYNKSEICSLYRFTSR